MYAAELIGHLLETTCNTGYVFGFFTYIRRVTRSNNFLNKFLRVLFAALLAFCTLPLSVVQTGPKPTGGGGVAAEVKKTGRGARYSCGRE